MRTENLFVLGTLCFYKKIIVRVRFCFQSNYSRNLHVEHRISPFPLSTNFFDLTFCLKSTIICFKERKIKFTRSRILGCLQEITNIRATTVYI